MDKFTFKSPPKKLSIILNTTFIFLLLFYITTNVYSQSYKTSVCIFNHNQNISKPSIDGCTGLSEYTDYASKCSYVRSNKACWPKGYINYLEIFFCSCGQAPKLGYAILLTWLALLFYLLGNTAADYFCPSIESLSTLLKLSPTIAGTTLLPLGNGATDVFSSIVSFTRSGDGDVGFNGVLGGAFFISSIVVGVISLLINSREVSIDKPSFTRDVLFLLFALSFLLAIFIVGRINLWIAICFASIYFIYICVVSAMHLFCSKKEGAVNPPAISQASRGFSVHKDDDFGEMDIPLLGCVDEERCILSEKDGNEDFNEMESTSFCNLHTLSCYYLAMILSSLELPLYLPRRLTIPMVSEERWSKPCAVIAVTLAPILLAALWNTQRANVGSKASLEIYLTAGLIGIILGNLAFVGTKDTTPPTKCLFLWVAGGFLMSITWTYIIAEELVSLLVSFGNILGISPSILGLTVLAWGNSMGDLISNSAIALKGGPDGAQIAISGCYAGPLFNTLMGLGLSLVFASWSEYPSSYVIPADSSLFETIGFLMVGLLWALVILPKKNMRPDRFLGFGLLGIYLCFLFLRLARGLGVLN